MLTLTESSSISISSPASADEVEDGLDAPEAIADLPGVRLDVLAAEVEVWGPRVDELGAAQYGEKH